MKALKPMTRNCIAWIAVNRPHGTVTTEEVPKEYRKGLSGLLLRDHIVKVGNLHDGKIYTITEKGRYSASHYAQDEMQMMRST